MAKLCSIIVPLFNKVELTRKCVDAVLANTDPALYELILVDNASTDGTAEYCATLGDDIRVIRNDENQGFSKANNQAAAVSTGEFIVLLNNDTEVHSGWLEPLIGHMSDPRVAAVGTKLLFPDGTIQHCGVVLTHDARRPDMLGPMHWRYRAPADTPDANVARRYQVVTAAAMLVRRSVYDEVGGLDEGYWNGYEDVDLCLSIGAAGYTIMYEPTSVVTHHESASGPERFRKVTENELRLTERWFGRVSIDVRIGLNGGAVPDPDGIFFHQPAGPIGAEVGMGRTIAVDAQARERSFEPAYSREATLEELDTLRLANELSRQRGARDVCWLEGDDPHPLVTVRIATYNRGPLVVERAINSALAQTYSNIEVLVVGDACDDATTDAVMSVDDPRVRFVRLPTRGLYPAEDEHRWMVAGGHPMITALDLARGAWIAPCDDDDEITPDHVEVLLAAAKARRLEMVWSKARCETPTGRWSELGGPGLRCGYITHGSVMYSLGLRQILPNIRSWRMGEPGDWNLWRRMNNIGVRAGFVDHVTYVHYAEARHRESEPVGASS